MTDESGTILPVPVWETSPWSRPVAVTEIPDSGLEMVISADADILPRLAAFIGVTALESVQATFRLQRQGRMKVRVNGEVRADIIQTCVVSLEPFAQKIQMPAEANFAQESNIAASRPARHSQGEDAAIDVETMPDFDPIENGRIDLGAVATEFLVLSLDPYPKKPGAVFEEPDRVPVQTSSPFAGLSALGRDTNGKI